MMGKGLFADILPKGLVMKCDERGRPFGAPVWTGSEADHPAFHDRAAFRLQGAGRLEAGGRQSVAGGGGGGRGGDRAEAEKQGDEKGFLHGSDFLLALGRSAVHRPPADGGKLPVPWRDVCSAGNRACDLAVRWRNPGGFVLACRYSRAGGRAAPTGMVGLARCDGALPAGGSDASAGWAGVAAPVTGSAI